MTSTVQQAINDWAKSIEAALPDDVKKEISHCNSSLFNGPLYLDSEGEPCSMFDDCDKTAHDFSAGCKLIAAALDNDDAVCDLYIDEDGGVSTSEPEGEEIDGEWCDPLPYTRVDRKQVIAAIVGRELAQHV